MPGTRHQLDGGSLAGKDSSPHSSTMSKNPGSGRARRCRLDPGVRGGGAVGGSVGDTSTVIGDLRSGALIVVAGFSDDDVSRAALQRAFQPGTAAWRV